MASGDRPDKQRVVVAGFGTVGQAVVRLLQQELGRYSQELGIYLELSAIFDRSYGRKDTSWVSPEVQFTDSLESFLELPADIVVELIGGQEPATRIIQTSLEQGKNVVTANKLIMARQGRALLELAARGDRYLGFEAAVAGGVPIISALRQSLRSDSLAGVRGILNGTSNFILTQMAEEGRGYKEVLAEAQSLGYAEADPTMDVSGGDASDKLAILCNLCFHVEITPDRIPTQGITEIEAVDLLYANRLNATVKLLGVAMKQNGNLSARVAPFLIDHELELAKVSGVLNAIEVSGGELGSVVLTGRGAGGGPTAVSVVGDVLNAARWRAEGEGHVDTSLGGCRAIPADVLAQANQSQSYPFYLRFLVQDRPGIIATLSHILAKRDINIDWVLQEKWPDRSRFPFVITVESTLYSKMLDAVEEMTQLDFNRMPPLVLPILRE